MARRDSWDSGFASMGDFRTRKYILEYGGKYHLSKLYDTVDEATAAYDPRHLHIFEGGMICGVRVVAVAADDPSNFDRFRVVKWLVWDRYPHPGEKLPEHLAVQLERARRIMEIKPR